MSTTNDRQTREIIGQIARRLPSYLRLCASILQDARIPKRAKAPLVGAIGYGVSPIDLVPGIIPVFGQLDDLLVLFSGLRLALSQIDPTIADEHLTATGLSREQIDRDAADCLLVARRLGAAGARGVVRLTSRGMRLAKRVTGQAVRQVRGA